MKKRYVKPQMETMEIDHGGDLLCGSPNADNASGNVFDDEITGSSEPGRSRECDDWDDEEDIF